MTLPDPHEFREDVNDYSMCMCGIPAITHDAVMLKASIAPPSSPVETTGADSGTELRPCDSEALTEAYGQQVTLTLEARATITKQYIAITRLKAAIAEKDDAMLTAMRNLVANDATIRQLTRERDEAVRISHEWRNKFERAKGRP